MRHVLGVLLLLLSAAALADPAPAPLLSAGHPVDWWYTFKFNSASFPECSAGAARACAFGGTAQGYQHWGQQYAYASSEQPTLQAGGGCAGDSTADPIGATFDQIYNGNFNYVVWNDQFYDAPKIAGCTKECGSPWGHSKGVLAWNDAGEGVVMQVTTPSWPAAGNASHPRQGDGNTLGCVADDDVEVSQGFFAAKLTKDDLVIVLQALANGSVVTDTSNPQLARNGGPSDILALVAGLGRKSNNTTAVQATLSSGIVVISKPSSLHVPPWQMVSALLGGVPLKAATWWAAPKIPSTSDPSQISCWSPTLPAPGPVQIALSGQFGGKTFGFQGKPDPDGNHAKLGVSTGGDHPYSIFGDMNQQGAASGANCGSSQNGRGGTFYVVENQALHDSIASLLSGDVASGPVP